MAESSKHRRPAGRRLSAPIPRALAAAGLAAVVAVLAVPVAAGSADDELTPPTIVDYQDILAAPPDDAYASPEPTTAAERTESQTAHADLSDTEALDLAQAEFADLLSATLIPELDLPPDQEVDKYLDAHTARIETEGDDPNLLVESIGLPMRAPEAGQQEPLSGDLEPQGDHLEAENAIVEAELPTELDQGLDIPTDGAEVTVVPTEAADVEAEPVSDKAFYANADTDTDYLLAPTATGAELVLQLRSADSPESHPLSLEIPAGASLVATPDGGAEVTRDGEPIIAVSPPAAWDAAGADVPVSYAISGNRLTIEVSHRAGSHLYPIMVDPLWAVVDQYNWGAGQQNPNLDYWYSWSTHPNDFSSFYHVNEGGVMNRALGGRNFVAGSFAHWVATPIRASYIERVDFFNFDRSPTSPGACTTLGIWNNTTWAYGTVYNPANNSYQYSQPYANLCNNAAHETRHFWVGTSATPDGDGTGDYEAATGSSGIFALTSSGGYRSTSAENVLRSAYVYRWDRNNPTITSPTQSSGWMHHPTFTVSDAGLGAYGVWVWQGYSIVGTGNAGCTGAHQSVCPTSANIPVYDLPEGRNSLTAVGIDPVVNGSAGQGWTARIDRSPPQVSALSGSLVTNKDNVRADQSYALNLSATDGSLASTSQMRSGVKKLEVFVDDETEPRFSAEQTCANPDGSCSMPATWNVPPGEFVGGQHTIRVQATDMVGNYNGIAQVLNITAQGDDVPPTVDVSIDPPAANGSTVAHVQATDPGTMRSGVTDLTLYVDGSPIYENHQPCPAGGCAIAADVPLSAAQAPAAHEIVADATDGAGNDSVPVYRGAKLSGYSYVGFNDEFARASWSSIGVDAAGQSGANVIRLPVDWCDIAHDAPDRPGLQHGAPGTWHWDQYDAFFDTVQQRNLLDGDSEAELQVLAVAAGSPPWARGGSGLCTGPNYPPSAGFEDVPNQLGDWAGFIRELVTRYSAPSEGLLAVQAWNEPNNPDYWGGAVQPSETGRFARLVNEAAAEVDAANPSVKVFAGAVSPSGYQPFQFMLDSMDPNRDYRVDPNGIDGIAVHLYAFDTASENVSNDREAREKIRNYYDHVMNDLRDAYADKHRWITEIGFPSSPVANKIKRASIATQRSRLLRAFYKYAQLPRVKAFIIHRLAIVTPPPSEVPAEPGDFGLLSDGTGLPVRTDSTADQSAYCLIADRLGRDPSRC